MRKKPGTIVIGGDYQGLGIIRSLGKRGIPVYLLDTGTCIGKVSRFTSKFFAYPQDSLNEEATLLEFLLALAEQENLNDWVIYPTTDEVVKLIAINKNELEKYYKIPTPKWEVTEILYNKKLTCKLAIDLGIPIPKTYFPDIESVHNLNLQFPVIIKPLSKGIFYKLTKKKALKVRNKKELIKMIDIIQKLPLHISEIMIQEMIPGGPSNLYSFCSLFKEGNVLVKLSARRLRQHPMDFGRASTFVETVDIPELEMLGTKLLSKLNYYGLSEVEFMWDPRDKTYKLLEVNPRTWGWHTLGSGIGLDFPLLLYKDLMGENLAQYIVPLQKDVKWIRILTDTGLVVYEILKGRMKVCEYISSLKGKKEYAVWLPQDPLPFLFEIFLLPWLFKTRGF